MGLYNSLLGQRSREEREGHSSARKRRWTQCRPKEISVQKESTQESVSQKSSQHAPL
jgi:hypothetical protein